LYRICQEQDTEQKRELVREYARELDAIDYEVSEELRQLGEKVIAGMPELYVIKEFDVKVGYVLSYEAKKKDGKDIAADCRKVTGTYKAYLPFDFIVTFYEPNMSYMTENQKKVLMLHELKHIGIGERGLKIEPHNIEDFASILTRYGLDWNAYSNDVIDILAGGDSGSKERCRTKSDKVATGRKTKKNS
jgi:hypothetical protein